MKLKIRARMGVDLGEDRHIAVLNRELSQDVLDGRGTCVCRSIFGGRSFDEQKEWAYQKMDIMVATPGRMVDMLDRRATNLRHATYFVLEPG